jgi:hypothetical protein
MKYKSVMDREWTWFDNLRWIIKEKVIRFLRILTTHKCEAKDCQRRLEGKYRWCSLECYVYCGNKLEDLSKEMGR